MTRRGARALLAAGVTTVLLAGCAAQEPPLTESASLALSTGVLDVATAASTGDLATALATLDGVQQQLDGALARDEVTPDRAARIQLSIDTVRADLHALAAATVEEPVPTPVEPSPPAEVTEQPVEEAPVDEPPTDHPGDGPADDGGPGKGDDGNGNDGNGNGKGNKDKPGKGPGANNGKGKGARD